MKLPLSLALGLAAASLTAAPMDVTFDLGPGATYDHGATSPLSAQERFRVNALSDLLDLRAALTVNSDQKYGADVANFKDNNTFFNNYFFVDEGYTVLKALPGLTVAAGRMPQVDLVNSPYSLFLNSRGLPASGTVLGYEDSGFLYEDRWISLTSRSSFANDTHAPPAWQKAVYSLNPVGGGFPDRGANLKSFVFKRGTMRFGFQDGVVYSGRSFDGNYFFSPVPQYFTQYFYAMAGRPWSTNWTDKYHMGGFWDWNEPDFDVNAQVLVNDFSLHFLFPGSVPNNPWKAAWTVGGRIKTPWGRWGLYHAGALKYTFEPITASSDGNGDLQNAVGMTYTPDVEYWVNGDYRALAVEDNAIGYLHGENNLALMATWESDWAGPLHAKASLEYLVAGNNSPANPWQDMNFSNDVGTQLLNDPLWEHRITLSTRWDWTQGPWTWFAAADLGVRINPLTAVAPDLPAGTVTQPGPNTAGWTPMDTLINLYKPQRGLVGIERLTLGGSYT
ncbi:MAG TPA: hypothetical protein VMB23_03155, partial [Spirochaetia bacterium]|nr:hypothetical protein [Spirochaetia bacterium]